MVGIKLSRLLIATVASLLVFAGPADPAYMPQLAATTAYGPALLTSSSRFGPGQTQALIMYADPDSGGKWFKTWGRAVDVAPGDIAMDAGGSVIVVGSYPFLQQFEYAATPAFAVKFSNSGSLLWEREITWADYSVRLNAVTVDPLGDIYATGLAWKYDDVADPEGWFAQVGFIFTCRLTADGEIVWAHRWSRDFYSRDQGRGIAVFGNSVGVIGEYRDSGYSGFVMLFMNAADGSTFGSQALVIPDSDVFINPNGLAVNSSGLFTGVCTMQDSMLDSPLQDTIIMPCFLSDGSYQFTHSWGAGQERFASGNDIAACDEEFYIAAGLGAVPSPPDPEWPERIVSDPLALAYAGPLATDYQRFWDDSPQFTSAEFTSAAAKGDGTVWVAGYARFADQNHYGREYSVYPGLGFSAEPLEHVTAWDDSNCGSSSLAISGSVINNPAEPEVLQWLDEERIYVGNMIFNYVRHVPHAVLTADVTEGTGPLTVQLDASASTIDIGSIESYQWTWYRKDLKEMDNDHDTGTTSSVTFNEPGTYYVVVTLTSDDDSTSYAWVEVKVQPGGAGA